MQKKIALKRLSSSDLTLFEAQYRKSGGTKQKAINLDSDVFVDMFFPGLPSRLNLIKDRVFVTLAIQGPAAAGVHSITRKILKQTKNWRLNGELIVNPPEEPGRYDSLSNGDFAILDFSGEHEPHAARMYLVSKVQDIELHSALDTKYSSIFSPRRGMRQIDPDELAALLGGLSLTEGHPVYDFIDFDALEDASQGGQEGLSRLKRRRKSRGVSREELARARQNAEQIGRLGEELLNGFFSQENVVFEKWRSVTSLENSDFNFSWDADVNAIAPYDFSIFIGDRVFRRIDAKSTAGEFKNKIHVSVSELSEMAHGGAPYDIFRLYSITETSARLRIFCDSKIFAQGILDEIARLPAGVTVDSVSIDPVSLSFGDEILIDLVTDAVFDELH